MSKIKSKNTLPELIVRKFLFSKGFRYRLHLNTLPGKPDVVLKKYKIVIFIHGCFWHAHSGCKHSVRVKSNTEYWLPKIQGNADRDKIAESQLKSEGWNVLIIWECQLKAAKIESTLQRLWEDVSINLK